MSSENKENTVEECEIENINIEDPDELEERTPEEIEEILEQANILSTDIATIIQTLHASSTLSFNMDTKNSEYLVMEVDETVKNALDAGESLTFRGDPNEPAVFCINNKTYEVKEAETSNTCLIVPDLKCSNEVNVEDAKAKLIEKKEIRHCYNKYLELTECRPKLNKLRTVLEPSSFRGPENEKLLDPLLLYDWERLRNEIPASDGEIKNALAENLVVEMDGFYRLIGFEYESLAVGLMLELVEDNSWTIDTVDKEASYECVKEIIPKPIFEILFAKYAEPSHCREDGTQLYKYDEAKSCRLLANILLNTSPINTYSAFMEAWKMGCTEYLEPKEEYLYGVGIVVYNKKAMRKEIMLYLESSLSDNLNKRLNELFQAKDKWTLEEITPYLTSLTTKTQDVNAILTKFTRSSMREGIKYYSAKHGK